jgi:Protein of unknown function (DUF4239)
VSIGAALLIIALTNALAIAVMLAVRRRSPEGHFRDSQKAAAVFTVIGTAFAVLLAFVFLLAFQSYLKGRDSAGQEAVAVTTLFSLAQQLDAPKDRVLEGEVICYARAVIAEWPQMREQRESRDVISTVYAIERLFARTRLSGPASDNAHAKWFDAMQDREAGRRGRLVEAAPFVPPLVWIVLGLSGAFLICFTVFFADRREQRWSQVLMIVSVTTVVVSSMVVIRFLDSPYDDHPGSVRPAAMKSALAGIQQELGSDGIAVPARCDSAGRPLSS